MEKCEYVSPKEYYSDKYKRAEIEKVMEYNKTHITPIKKDVNINQNSMAFMENEPDSYKKLWFKLYKTQNYSSCPEMFVGITGVVYILGIFFGGIG